MSMQRSIRISLAGAIAFALFGIASIATAQAMPQQQPTQQVPPPPPPPPQQPTAPPLPPAMPMPPPPPPQSPQRAMPPASPQGSSDQPYQGTKSSATYPGQNGTLTVNAGMPGQVQSYGPPPSFKSLDTNHDGRISQSEAQAYPPLDSDFLFASSQGKTISRAQYSKWVKAEH